MSAIATYGSAKAIGYSFPIIGGVLVALRFYTRLHQKVKLQIDDWLCIPAWLCVLGCDASILAGVHKNVFVDAAITGPDDVTTQERELAQITASLVILWMGANVLIKLSVLFFYRRIFIGRAFSIANWFLIGLSGLWFIYAILSWFLYCGTHVKADLEGGWLICPLWGFDIQMGVFVLDSTIDFCILLMPIPFVWKLQLDRKRKIAVLVIFLLGGFAFVAGLNNTIIQLEYLINPAIATSSSNFFQGSSLLFSDWPAIEIGVGLIACNLPSLSFKIVNTLPNAIRRGFSLSWTGIRNAAAAFTLRSGRTGSRHSSRDREIRTPKTYVRTESENTREGGGSLALGKSLSKQSSASVGAEQKDIALADLRAPDGAMTARGRFEGYNNDSQVEPIRGFNAV